MSSATRCRHGTGRQTTISATVGSLLICTILAAQPGSAALAAARQAMSSGIAAADRGDLVEAKHQFQRATTLAPGIAESHAALGSVLLSLHEADAALAELQTAHRLAPRDTNIDLNLANAELASGRFSSATDRFRQALSSRPDGFIPVQDCIAFASALSAAGRDENAESLLRDALAESPASAELEDALGTMLAKRGSFQDALPLFEDAVKRQPSFSRAQGHLGSTLLALGQPFEAIGPLRTAASANPDTLAAQLDLGRALSAVHRDADALDTLHRAMALLRTQTSPQAIYSLALALQASGDSRSALPLFEKIENSRSSNREFLINYALARVQTGDAKAAIPLYAKALAAGPDTASLRQDYGVAYLQQADLDNAIEQFQKGLALNRNDASLHYDLGLALKLKDNLSAAIPEFERAAQLDSQLPDPPYTLGILYMQQGRFAEASAQFRRTISLQPNNGDAWALLGGVLKDSGSAAEAADALQHAIQLQPDQPSLHVQMATLKLQAGDKDGAAAERKIAADLSRTAVSRQRASFALNSGRSLLQQGRLDDALTQLIIALQADSTVSEAHKLLAVVYDRQGKTAEAAIERQKAATLDAAVTGAERPVE